MVETKFMYENVRHVLAVNSTQRERERESDTNKE